MEVESMYTKYQIAKVHNISFKKHKNISSSIKNTSSFDSSFIIEDRPANNINLCFIGNP